MSMGTSGFGVSWLHLPSLSWMGSLLLFGWLLLVLLVVVKTAMELLFLAVLVHIEKVTQHREFSSE